MKVYVVELDDVEEHSPIGVFSTEEKAKSFIREDTDRYVKKMNDHIKHMRESGYPDYGHILDTDVEYKYDTIVEFEVDEEVFHG